MDNPKVSPEEAGEEAGRIFASGFYCAESVLLAVARANGLETPELTRLATGLCSGISRCDGPCGAFSGGVLALGLLFGREHPEEPVDPCYALSQRFKAAFEHRWGSTSCTALLGCNLGSPEARQHYRDAGLKLSICEPLTRWAAACVQEICLAAG